MDTSLITQATTQQAQSAYADALSARALGTASGAQKDTTGQLDMAKAKKAAQQFEGFFVGQMMEYMMAGMKADSNFGGGQAEETWRSMLNQEYGKEIAKSGKLGISDKVMKSMLEMQEKQTRAKVKLGEMQTQQSAPASDQVTAMLPQAAAAAGTLAKASMLDMTA